MKDSVMEDAKEEETVEMMDKGLKKQKKASEAKAKRNELQEEKGDKIKKIITPKTMQVWPFTLFFLYTGLQKNFFRTFSSPPSSNYKIHVCGCAHATFLR